jgi:hypothetical protein
MTTRTVLFVASPLIAALALPTGAAQALTMSECSAKYKDAKAAGPGTIFAKSNATSARPNARPAPPRQGAANAVFPTAVDAKYATEKPGRARRKTCLDQYKANKANSANGGLKWLQRGGGYYSQCTKKLKGAA